jgi:hypothetical protein
MKKTYDSTIDEAVRTAYRLACMTGAVKKQRWMGLAWVPIAFLLFYHIVPRSTEEKVITAVVMSVVVAAAHLISIGPLIKNNIRKTFVKTLGTADPVQAEYELADDALVFRKMGHELRLSWQSVVRFEDSPTTLDVFTQPTGLAMIPKRIFTGDDEVREWTEFIKQHMGRQSPAGDSQKLAPEE